jgi:putative transposase
MKAREQHRIVSKGFLIATWVNDDGFREVLGFTVADGESEAAWHEFFLSLKERGLAEVDLVTSDDHGGLTKAISKQFCGASWQHCQTHFSKNMLDRTPKKLQPELKVALTDLENAPGLSEATARKDQLIERYQEEAPKRVALLDERFDEITAALGLPEPYRKRLRTSNSIERLNEELRRRERVIRIFPNETSMIRLMGSVLMEMHERWMTGKKYFTMERYEADKEEARKAMQLDSNELNHTDQFIA